jgi:hypothetical protein
MKLYLFLLFFLITSCRDSQQTFFDTYYHFQNYEFEENIVNLFDFKTITECDSFIYDYKKFDSYSLVIPFENKIVPVKLYSYKIRRLKNTYSGRVKLYFCEIDFFLPNNENLIKYKDKIIEWNEIENILFEIYKNKNIKDIYFALEENINQEQIQKLFDVILKGYNKALDYKSRKYYKTEFDNLNLDKKEILMRRGTEFRIGKPLPKKIKPQEGFKKPIIPIKKD